MPLKPEAALETRVVTQARLHGYTSYKLAFLGVRGGPDRLFGREGEATLMELKQLGEEPTKQQLKRHGELREAFGLRVVWADHYALACYYLNIPE